MGVAHARVDIRDDDRRAARAQVPRGRCRDLKHSIHVCLCKLHVVRCRKQVVIKIWLDVLDAVEPLVTFYRVVEADRGGQLYTLPAKIAKTLKLCSLHLLICGTCLSRARTAF